MARQPWPVSREVHVANVMNTFRLSLNRGFPPGCFPKGQLAEVLGDIRESPHCNRERPERLVLMKEAAGMEQYFRYQIAACPKCGARKTVSWARCEICGSAVFHETQSTPVVEEDHDPEPSFVLDVHFAAQVA